MTTAQLIIVCGTVLVLAFIVAAVRLAPLMLADAARTRGAADGESVVVHTLDQRSIRGTVVADEDATVVALADAAYLQDGKTQPVGGVVRVPLSNLAFTQAL
jgi:hypothetical protein